MRFAALIFNGQGTEIRIYSSRKHTPKWYARKVLQKTLPPGEVIREFHKVDRTATPIDKLLTAKEDAANRFIPIALDSMGIDKEDFFSRKRTGTLAGARQLICKVLYDIGGLSYNFIGRAIGRDHTTVIHHVQTAANFLENEPDYLQNYESLLSLYHKVK